MKISDALKESRNHIPINEARILLCYLMGQSIEYLIMNGEKALGKGMMLEFKKLIERRKHKEPIAYITGIKEFYSHEFFVDQSVLIPRPDTETLVESVIKYIQKNKLENSRILELGIGSGCIALSILLECSNCSAIGVDISLEAIEVAKKNIEKFNIDDRYKIIRSNWFENVDEKFDIIISNPPYIDKDDADIMAEETYLHEPQLALFASNSGYEAFEKIASSAKKYLNDNGKIFLEIGLGQCDKVRDIFLSEGLQYEDHVKDLSGIIRCLIFSL
mgnify:CR=1 FL=1